MQPDRDRSRRRDDGGLQTDEVARSWIDLTDQVRRASLRPPFRGVAQPGSAHGSGPWSRRFKSSRPDESRDFRRKNKGNRNRAGRSLPAGCPDARDGGEEVARLRVHVALRDVRRRVTREDSDRFDVDAAAHEREQEKCRSEWKDRTGSAWRSWRSVRRATRSLGALGRRRSRPCVRMIDETATSIMTL